MHCLVNRPIGPLPAPWFLHISRTVAMFAQRTCHCPLPNCGSDCSVVLCVLGVALCVPAAMGENWPCWRGPRGDGTSLEKNIPTALGRPGEREHRLEGRDPRHGPRLADRLEDRIFLVILPRGDRQERVLAVPRSADAARSSGSGWCSRAAGKEAPAEQLRLEHAGHRRPAGLRHLPRPRPDARGRLRLRGQAALAGPARASSPASTAFAARRSCSRTW